MRELPAAIVTGAAERSGAAKRMRKPDDSLLKYVYLAPAVIYYTVFFALPLVFLIWIGFWRVENYQLVMDFTFDNYREIFESWFARSRYGMTLIQSFWVGGTTAVIATAFAYGIAVALVYAVPERWQRLALLFAIAPFWSSYVLRLYSWQTILAKNGLVNSVLGVFGFDALQINIIYTQMATRVGLVHFLTPIIVVVMYVTVSNIDKNLIEAARELGATRWQAFKRVIFPLSKFGLISSISFAAIICLGDALSGALLGGGAGASIIGKIPLYANMLMTDYASSTNLPRTSALATILVLIMILLMAAGFVWAEKARRETSE